MTRRVLLFLALVAHSWAQIPAFPGAEGYGGYANGGRGGDVYIVTNLNASGAGSFRDGIETVPPAGRTIVFAVSGHIHINGLRLTGSKVTVAGQTAPGDGVGLVDGTFRISGDDVVVRHMRFRHRKSGSGGDCVNLDSGSVNSVLDSISMQFSTDENFSSFNSPPENVTMQWSVNAWGLESHSCGGLWDQNHATAHHTLWAHNHTRNPKARPNGLLEWINNVTFDWDIGFIMGDSETPASWKANVRNSYFLCPPGNLRSKALEKANLDRNGNPNFSLYLNNCRHDNDGDGILNGSDKGYAIASGNYITLAAPAANTGSIPVTMDDPVVGFKKIVSKAGALRLDIDPAKPLRDEVDARLIQNLVTQTRNHITRESDLAGVSNGGIGTLNSTAAPLDTDKDGMPDFYETALGWNPAVQDHNSALANSGGLITGTTFMPPVTVAGYTRLEEYLHYLAIPHGTVARNIAGSPTNAQVDLRKFTSGFSVSPVFTVSNIIGGTIAQSGTGNCIVTFTPTLNFVGRARFDFTVTDSAGHGWTQTCALVVTNAGLPRDLQWQGGLNSNAWDGLTTNWLRDSTATAFSSGDRVSFNDSGSKTPAVNVTGSHVPGSIDFDATSNYTLSGTGALTSTGPLSKRGTGTLVINNTGPNAFSSVNLEAGILTVAANTLGSGPLNLQGGTLNIGATATSNSVLNILGPVTITGGSGGGSTGIGALSGSAPLTIAQTNVFDLRGDMAAYSGNINFTGNAAIRMNGSTGSAAATFTLGGTTTLNKRSNAASITLGALSGSSGTTLSGSNGTGNTTATTFIIGGNNASTTFSGSIANGAGPSGISKTGSGTFTLGGTSSYTGVTAVNAGALLVDGTLGNSAVTVANAALLGGDGNIGGSVTANSGAILSPGTVPFTGANLNITGGLALAGNTLYYDMTDTPAGENDKIVVGGTLALTGNQYFQFLLLDGPLEAGIYDLITANTSSASGVSLSHNLPADSRQTFAVYRNAAGSNPSKVWLAVAGNPGTLEWTGAASGVWDKTTANNWAGATPNTFYNNDAVVFNDNSSVVTVGLIGVLRPRQITVANTSRAYTFNGSGNLSGVSSLLKTGTGTLTLAPSIVIVSTTTTGASNVATVTSASGLALGMAVLGGGFPYGTIITNIAGTTITFSAATASTVTENLTYQARNDFSGGTTIVSGIVQLANEAANRWGLGQGPVTFNGGTLKIHDSGANLPGAGDFPNDLIVPVGQSGTLHTPQRGSLSGRLTGGGVLDVVIRYVRGDFYGDWSAFNGQINISAATGSEFRMAESYSPDGFPNAAVNLGAGVAMKHVGILSQGAGTTIGIGELSGAPGSTLLGGVTGGRALTYLIGGKGTDATFAGNIAEQTPGSTLTNLLKTGAGTWTLSGTGSWAGGTGILQGILNVSGNMTSAGAIAVSSGASLILSNGTVSTDVINIDDGASLKGYGVILSDLNSNGILETRGFATGTPGNLTIQGSAFLGPESLTRMRAGGASDLITVGSDVALGGILQVSLSPGTAFGRYPLITCAGAITGMLELSGVPAGTTAHLSTTVNGRVDLVVDDSDEDGLPDSWEQSNFGNLAETATGDRDGDESSNLVEYRLKLNPSSASSAFRAACSGTLITWPSAPGLVFTVKRSLLLETQNWQTLATVIGGPGTVSSYNDPASFTKAFYRVEFTP